MSYGRFSECWQFDAEWPGTPQQQLVIVKAFELEYGSDHWKLFKRLDRSINQVYKRSYMTIGFLPDDMFDVNRSVIAGITGINFRQSYAVSALKSQVEHELFHVVDKHLLTWANRLWFINQLQIDPNLNTWNHNVQETWADAGRDWWNGQGWASLTPILAGD